MARSPQLKLLENQNLSYGGSLLNTRKGRAHGRPISTRETMHLVLRSTRATGQWSFQRPENKKRIEQIVRKFAVKYAVKVMSLGNVGNHLHFHIKLGHRASYRPFVRAITGSIVMAITGASRWKRVRGVGGKDYDGTPTIGGGGTQLGIEKFWDYRPFSRVVRGFQAMLSLKDYIDLNALEGIGMTRKEAKGTQAIANRRPWLIIPRADFS